MALPALAQQSDEDDQGEGLVPALPRRVVEENRIKVPEYRDHENSCRRAEAAAAAGEWTTAVRTYLDVLRQERDPDGGIQHVVKVGDKRWLSYARFVRERLLRMPAEGRKAFREQADAEARALFDDAVARRDARGLDAVWRTFPLATCAAEALERLGDMAFEAGDFGLAAIRYERAGALP
ncbi:MAG TPA: hypothetical protein VHF22_05470, partial [Planctomycetota bacterium]|nr:hypothetical protein [Planctomycetota bacterium]